MKTTSKFILFLALVSLFACGKKNASVNSPVGLVGNGRANRSFSEFDYHKGRPYLISKYVYLTSSNQVGIYARFRFILVEPQKPTTTSDALAATVVGPTKPVIGSPTIPPTTPQKPMTRTYNLFIEKYAACADGPLGSTKTKILFDHSYLHDTVSFMKGSPITIPGGGVVSFYKGSGKTGSASYAHIALEKAVDVNQNTVMLNLWPSTNTFESLVAADKKLPVLSDKDRENVTQQAAKACANVTSAFVPSQIPEDVETGPTNTQTNQILGDVIQDQNELQDTNLKQPSPDDGDLIFDKPVDQNHDV